MHILKLYKMYSIYVVKKTLLWKALPLCVVIHSFSLKLILCNVYF